MKNHFPIVSASILTISAQPLLAQGSLSPSAAPAATMKTLDEIHESITDASTSITTLQDEKRTAISSLPYTITQPGSYYLTGSLESSDSSGITVSSSYVTIDLNGFTLTTSSTATAGDGGGIYVAGTSANPLTSVTIKNGIIEGYLRSVHFQHASHSKVEDIISGKSTLNGIDLEDTDHSLILFCDETGAGTHGIIIENGSNNTIQECTISKSGANGIEINDGNNNTINQCVVADTNYAGIWMRFSQANTCHDSLVYTTALNGIYVTGSSATPSSANKISSCVVGNAFGAAYSLNNVENSQIFDNHASESQLFASGSSYGIRIWGTSEDNMIHSNTCHGNTDNFNLDPDDIDAPRVSTTGELSTTGAAAHPLANFSF